MNFMAWGTNAAGETAQPVQSGKIQTYTMWFLGGIIILTAVRVVGKILYGTCENPEHLKLTDATWDERFTVICLIAAVAGLGLAPFWVSDVISHSVDPIILAIIK